jgi:histidinol-phosphate phosphatase family protein
MECMSARAAYGVLGDLQVPLGLGLLRLSTEDRPAETDAVALIHTALDAGIRVLDTADSYALNDSDLHYGETLARKALMSWSGARNDVRIVTKVGMSRPKGRWVPNARPAHIVRAVDGSLRALGVERLFLLMLHGVDAGTPFDDTLHALAELQRAGKVQHLGLCNVDVAEVRQAQRHFAVAAIQNELSVVNRKAAADGTLALSRELGAVFLAHRPLAGHAKVNTLEKNRAVKPIADRHGITRAEAALAALLDVGAPVLPLVGATRHESLLSSLRALSVKLDDTDRAALNDKITFEATPEARALLVEPAVPKPLHVLHADDPPGEQPEVVVIMGVQGAGKSTLVDRYVAKGYVRLNRDLAGGGLDDLLPLLAAHLADERTRVVLDNTYATRVSRWHVVRAAHHAGVPVRCIYLATPVRDALVNIVTRLLTRYGRLLGPDELKELGKADPNLPPPAALARFAACFEPPHVDEGFGVVQEIPFKRREPDASTDAAPHKKGLLLDVDGTLRRCKSGALYPVDPDDIELLPRRAEVLRRYVDDGYSLFFVSNQSGVASGNVSLAEVEKCFARTVELLQLPVDDIAFCPHPAFPAGCFCRKPMPGLGVMLMHKHKLARGSLLMVGDMDSDRQFAESIAAQYEHADDFFADRTHGSART